VVFERLSSVWQLSAASAAVAAPGSSAETAMAAAKARREILNMVDVSIGLSDQSRLPETVNISRLPVRPDVVVAQRKTLMYFS